MITKEQFLQILKKYKEGNATEDERALLDAYYNLFEVEPEVLELMQPAERLALKQTIESHLFEKIEALENKPVHTINFMRWSAVAASILLVLSFGAYFILKDKPLKPSTEVAMDVAPGGNKAVLTLADGSQITLDEARNGELASQGDIKINKSGDGLIVYNASSSSPSSGDQEVQYNILKTPAGGQFQLVMPDGTKVWLNAETSLRFPARFANNERVVELEGEAYFEVAENKKKPFKVISPQQTIQVLGTHFNVMAYPNETEIKTTLLEGSVRVSNDKLARVLKPGEQSQVSDRQIHIKENVVIENEIAWKDGYFKFNENLQSIMKKISRWYDVEVIYEHEPDPRLLFGGEISRSQNLSSILNIMEMTGSVHFKIQGRRVIVMK